MTGPALYRGMDRAALDAAYNNTVAVADSARFITEWEKRSAEMAAAHSDQLDFRYGPRERNRVDFFRASPANTPVLVFIHGGYWQMRAKETFRFLANGPLAHGINVASVGYTLAPKATLQDIVDEIDTAITWIAQNAAELGGDATRLYISGWSAGGHLAALSLAHPAVCGALAISGIFDLEPIRLSFLNEKLRLTGGDVERLSPLLNLPRTSPPLMAACGAAELPELQRQSREFAAARARSGLPGRLTVLPNHNHFTILEELANPRGALTALVCELAA